MDLAMPCPRRALLTLLASRTSQPGVALTALPGATRRSIRSVVSSVRCQRGRPAPNQGLKESTFIEAIGKAWGCELTCGFDDNKSFAESLQGGWICEIPELQGFSKAETASIKAMVSRQVDGARPAYGRLVQDFPRKRVFMGSTNDNDYLRDATGGRRFWPIKCTVDRIDADRLEREIDRIWGEAVADRAMRTAQPHGTLPLYMADEAAAGEARLLQDSRRAETPEDILAGEMRAALDEMRRDGRKGEMPGVVPPDLVPRPRLAGEGFAGAGTAGRTRSTMLRASSGLRERSRTPIPKPDGPNCRWSTDFVHDQLANSRRFRVLTIIDDVTKECLAAVPDTWLSGKLVVHEMDALIARPGAIVNDNGAEFTSAAVLAFTPAAKLDWRYTRPGKPTRNALPQSSSP